MKKKINQPHLIVGTMKWGKWGADFSESQATDFLINCYESGFYHYDLADIYGNYQTEKLFGIALKNAKIPREELFITTKFGIEYPCEGSNYSLKSYNTTSNHLQKSLERSLNEVQTDYFDGYLLHRPDFLLNFEEVSREVKILYTQGKIKNFGVSNFNKNQFEYLNSYNTLSTNQIQFSLTHLEPLLNDDLFYFQDKQVPLMIWSPLGTIFKETNERNLRIRTVLEELSQKYHLSESQLLILFIKKLPNTLQPILGTTQLSRLKEIQFAFDEELEREDWYKLLEASRGKRVD